MSWFELVAGAVVGIFSMSALVIAMTLMDIADSLRKISEKER